MSGNVPSTRKKTSHAEVWMPLGKQLRDYYAAMQHTKASERLEAIIRQIKENEPQSEAAADTPIVP